MALEKQVECIECGRPTSLDEWLRNHDSCPTCSTKHILPRTRIALDAIENRETEAMEYTEVLELLGFTPQESTTLLLALGCSPEAALDIERTVVGDTPQPEWRRKIGETRKEMEDNLRETRTLLDKYGVKLDMGAE